MFFSGRAHVILNVELSFVSQVVGLSPFGWAFENLFLLFWHCGVMCKCVALGHFVAAPGARLLIRQQTQAKAGVVALYTSAAVCQKPCTKAVTAHHVAPQAS